MSPPPQSIADKRILTKVQLLVDHMKKCHDTHFHKWSPKHKHSPGVVAKKDLETNHELITEPITLTIEIRQDDIENFKFRLTADSSEIFFPFFRYDSKGPPHRNRNEPLPSSIVACPHFNVFDEHGFSVAYKTKLMSGKSFDATKVDDALLHFCDVGNIELMTPHRLENYQTSIPSASNPLNGMTF